MTAASAHSDATYLLSELIGGKVKARDRTIGKVSDLVATNHAKVPVVTHLIVERPFGRRPLMVPWDRVEKIEPNGAARLSIATPEPYEGEPGEGANTPARSSAR